MELKITDDRVREAAKGCPDAERVLKTLFPSVFEDQDVLKTNGLNPTAKQIHFFGPHESPIVIQNRTSGNFINRGFYLSTIHGYKWRIVIDNADQQVLVLAKDTVGVLDRNTRFDEK